MKESCNIGEIFFEYQYSLIIFEVEDIRGQNICLPDLILLAISAWRMVTALRSESLTVGTFQGFHFRPPSASHLDIPMWLCSYEARAAMNLAVKANRLSFSGLELLALFKSLARGLMD